MENDFIQASFVAATQLFSSWLVAEYEEMVVQLEFSADTLSHPLSNQSDREWTSSLRSSATPGSAPDQV